MKVTNVDQRILCANLPWEEELRTKSATKSIFDRSKSC